eukprot:144417-Amphidinium_carterae.1
MRSVPRHTNSVCADNVRASAKAAGRVTGTSPHDRSLERSALTVLSLITNLTNERNTKDTRSGSVAPRACGRSRS